MLISHRNTVAALALALAAASPSRGLAQQEPPPVWQEFVAVLRAADFPPERVKPYREELRAPMVGVLNTIRHKADWNEWLAQPETLRDGQQVHYLLPLTFDGRTATYCFSFVIEDGRWYFEHLESITIRMDRLGQLPVDSFPDLPERQKAWIREEWQVSKDVQLFNTLSAEKGAAAALDWFKDGVGYALTAGAWIPYVSPERAFILYLCWEQAHLRGSGVVLERLDDTSAVVRLRPLYLQLYEQTTHLKQQIPQDAYRTLFESVWRDRATAAGWNLDIACQGVDCVFHFAKR